MYKIRPFPISLWRESRTIAVANEHIVCIHCIQAMVEKKLPLSFVQRGYITFKQRALCVNSTYTIAIGKNAFRHYNHFYKHSNFSLFSSPISFNVLFPPIELECSSFHFSTANSTEHCMLCMSSFHACHFDSYLSFVDIIWNLRDSSVIFSSDFRSINSIGFVDFSAFIIIANILSLSLTRAPSLSLTLNSHIHESFAMLIMFHVNQTEIAWECSSMK